MCASSPLAQQLNGMCLQEALVSSDVYECNLTWVMCVGTQGTAAAAGLQDLTAKSAALLPEGGASDVGASVCKYAQEQKVRDQLHASVTACWCFGAVPLTCGAKQAGSSICRVTLLRVALWAV